MFCRVTFFLIKLATLSRKVKTSVSTGVIFAVAGTILFSKTHSFRLVKSPATGFCESFDFAQSNDCAVVPSCHLTIVNVSVTLLVTLTTSDFTTTLLSTSSSTA
jgi:hypothetical protein